MALADTIAKIRYFEELGINHNSLEWALSINADNGLLPLSICYDSANRIMAKAEKIPLILQNDPQKSNGV